jgi:hypothetical protein
MLTTHLKRCVDSAKPREKRQELELVMQRATALRMLHGYAAPEVERVYLRALELCREVPDMPERFGLEWQQMQYFLVRADVDTASKLATAFWTMRPLMKTSPC